MKVKSSLFQRPIGASLLAGLFCCLPAARQQAQIVSLASTTFQGQASAISGFVMGGAVSVANTGPLAITGGAEEAAVLEAAVATGFSAGVSHAAVIAGGNISSCEASAANVSFAGCGGFLFGATTSGMHVKATAVTGYQVDPNDADCRVIDYNVTIDNQPGTARVRVCDKGEPGRNDIFQIQLSNGYSAGGDLGGDRPGGGNIQLHTCRN